VPLEVIDRCQNHVLAGSRGRRDYAKAWHALSEHLEAIIQANPTSQTAR